MQSMYLIKGLGMRIYEQFFKTQWFENTLILKWARDLNRLLKIQTATKHVRDTQRC